ncbi:MAG: choice-of-anchor J domain-containing protein [Planctomycetota bacterium]
MNKYFFLLILAISTTSNAQIIEDFNRVFGKMAGDGNVPLEDWEGALQSDRFGPTGIFPGFDGQCGFFDAHQGEPDAYVAMNYRNARLQEIDVTSTWLISPVVNLTDRTTISFYTRTLDLSMFPDRLVVRLSTSGDSLFVGDQATDVGDFETVLFDINPTHQLGGYPEEWTKFETEINGFGDVTGRVAFHYFNESMNINGNYIGIDTFHYIPFLLGDINCDGTVNLLDIQLFVDTITSGVFNEKADLNSDGVVNLFDIDPFVDAIVQAG